MTKTTIPYRMEHNLDTDATHNTTETYVREREGKWYAFAVVGGIVFRNKQAFATKLEAERFNAVSKREGIRIEPNA